MNEDLRGKVFVATGGASGLGLASAQQLALLGAQLVLGDVNEGALDAASKTIDPHGEQVATQVVDVRRPEDCARLADLAVERFGTLHGAITPAGIDYNVPSLEMTLEQWQRLIDVNLTGTFLTVQATARKMVAIGSKGSIVTFASGIGVRGRPNGVHYAASKGGVIALSKSFALDLAKYGIRVNVVAPGVTDTPMARSVMSQQDIDVRARQIPLGRIGEPQDIANVVSFLLSDASGWLTGQTIHANGGVLMP